MHNLYYLGTLILTCGVTLNVGNSVTCLEIVMECAGQYCVQSVKMVHHGMTGGSSPSPPSLCCVTEASVTVMCHVSQRQHLRFQEHDLELHDNGVSVL